MPPISEIKITIKTRGMWKLALLTFLMRHKSANHIVHVHLNDGEKSQCITHGANAQVPVEQKPPSLAGQ